MFQRRIHIIITALDVEQATKEICGPNKRITEHCPVHIALRPFMNGKQYKVTHNRIYLPPSMEHMKLEPSLPNEFYNPSGWQLALNRINHGHRYEFTITKE